MPNFRLLGAHAFVLEIPGPHSLEKQQVIWQLHARTREWQGIRERVPGMNNLTLLFDPATTNADELSERVIDAWRTPASKESFGGSAHTVPVRYGGEFGPDIGQVAQYTGLSAREIIQRHTSVEYRVYFLGFQPGFAYLGDLDETLHVPRRVTPRTNVPPGSVAIAGMQTAVYPLASPGGWNIIGSTRIDVFDASREPAALFAPGDTVRFVAEQ